MLYRLLEFRQALSQSTGCALHDGRHRQHHQRHTHLARHEQQENQYRFSLLTCLVQIMQQLLPLRGQGTAGQLQHHQLLRLDAHL